MHDVALTDRQVLVLKTIKGHIESHGYPPTTREIGEAIGVKSTNCIVGHLEALERKGVIERDSRRGRALRVVDLTESDSERLVKRIGLMAHRLGFAWSEGDVDEALSVLDMVEMMRTTTDGGTR